LTAFFKDEGFQFATEIALGASYHRCADVGEVLATIDGVKDGDFDSWCDAWIETAERVEAAAAEAEAAGHRISAREAWQRASTYFDKAAFYMLGTRDPDRWTPIWRRHRQCFERAAALHDPPFERVEIPYEDTALEGWFFPARDEGGDGEQRRRLLLLNNGSDGTVLDMWVQGAAGATARGWHCLAYDGPGQGQAFHEQGLYFRPDWEAVVKPVVDYALSRPDVDSERIALSGVSQAGYWVPRAVAFEHRIAAAVADPGVVDVSTAMTDALPGSLRKHLEAGDVEKFNRQMDWGERFSKQNRFTLEFRGAPYGAKTPYDMFHAALSYRLDDETLAAIRCPMLITDPEGEQFWPGQSHQLYEALDSPKALVEFTAAEGGDSHCEPKAISLRDQRILDWLDETIA